MAAELGSRREFYFRADSATKLPAAKMASTTRINALTISEKGIEIHLIAQRIRLTSSKSAANCRNNK